MAPRLSFNLPPEIRPFDIVSELGYLASRSGVAMPPFRYEVGFKLPAHVYRRARLLHLQLRSLETALRPRPTPGIEVPL